MLLSERINMPNQYGRKRKDVNKSHRPRKYNSSYDESGKTGKENAVQRTFWRENKLEDIIKLTPKELDKVIDNMLESYKDKQRKKDPNWWFPVLDKKTFSEARYNKKLDKKNK